MRFRFCEPVVVGVHGVKFLERSVETESAELHEDMGVAGGELDTDWESRRMGAPRLSSAVPGSKGREVPPRLI